MSIERDEIPERLLKRLVFQAVEASFPKNSCACHYRFRQLPFPSRGGTLLFRFR